MRASANLEAIEPSAETRSSAAGASPASRGGPALYTDAASGVAAETGARRRVTILGTSAGAVSGLGYEPPGEILAEVHGSTTIAAPPVIRGTELEFVATLLRDASFL